MRAILTFYLLAGVIGATRGNGLGITGVLNNDNVCYIMGRVFGK